MSEVIRQLCQKCLHIRQRIRQMINHDDITESITESEDNPPFPDNPCIPYLRTVIEQLLAGKKLDYGEVNFVIVDGLVEYDEVLGYEEIENYQTSIWLEQRSEHLEEQLNAVLGQLSVGLNHLQIRTGRRAYFEDFCEDMFEENGLVVQMEGKEKRPFPHKSVILDMETEGSMMTELFREDMIYLPIYKKPWQIAPNLDITVPIGYNTVIVKGVIKQNETLHSDKFEREFYDSVEHM